MRQAIFALIVLILGQCALAQSRPPATAPSKPADLPAVNFNAIAFKDAVEFFADVSGANITVNWRALEKANVRPDTPVTMKIGGVTFRKALDMLLRQAGGGVPLTYTIDEGVLEITTQETEDAKLVTRVYGIQDLLFEAEDFSGAPQLSLSSTGSSGGGRSARSGGSGGSGGGGSGGNTGLFGNTNGNTNSPGSDGKSLSQKERADEIIKMITTSIRPEIWVENGGTSKISFYRGNLIVTAPASVHRQIGG